MVYEDLQPDIFIALCYAVIDLERNEANICIAGHSPPLHFPVREGGYTLLPTGGVPLGVDEQPEYESVRILFESGDTLIFYTDGVNHARDGNGEEFGEERLAQMFLNNRWLPSTSMAETLLKNVDAFEYGVRGDDLTILVLKRTE